MAYKPVITDEGRIIAEVDADLEDLIPGYFENRENDIVAILSALKNGDFEVIQRLGHSMKGSGGGYGFDGISEIGDELEDAAKAHVPEKIVSCVKTLEDYLAHVEVKYI